MSSTPIRHAVSQSPVNPASTSANEGRSTAFDGDGFDSTSARQPEGQERRGPELFQRPQQAAKSPQAATPTVPPPAPKKLTIDAALELPKDSSYFATSHELQYLRFKSHESRAEFLDFADKVGKITSLSVARILAQLYKVGENFYDDFVTQLTSLGNEDLNSDEWFHLCCGLTDVPDERRANVAEIAPKLFKNMGYWNRNELIVALGRIPLEHQAAFLEAAAKLQKHDHIDPSSIRAWVDFKPDKWPILSQVAPEILKSALPAERDGILHALAKMPLEHLSAVRDLLPLFPNETTEEWVNNVGILVSKNFYDALVSDVKKALQRLSPFTFNMKPLVNAVGQVRSDDLEGFISFAKDVAYKTQVPLDSDLLLALSNVSSQHREAFYGQVEVFLKDKTLIGRCVVLSNVARLTDRHREEFLAWLRLYISDEPFSTSLSSKLIGCLCSLVAWDDCARAKADLEFALRLVPMSTLEENPWELLTALGHVAQADRAGFPQLCQPLLAQQDLRLLIENLSSVCRTPANERAAHVQDLLHPNIAGRVSTENVMDSRRIQQTRAAIVALLGRFDGPIDREAHLDAIEDYLTSYPDGDIPQSEKNAFLAQRGGATEQDNALRTLSAPRRDGDYSNCLRDNDKFSLGDREMGLGDLTALVNQAIDAFAPPGQSAAEMAKEQALMRYGLFKQLSQCIEDDGHRVCGVGLSQRLVSVLQGRYPEVHIDEALSPDQFLAQSAIEFEAQLGDRDPSVVEVQAFYDSTIQRSQDPELGVGIDQVARVESQLREYVSVTYDWQPPARGA